jgi:serine/threonine-protein kinase
VKVLDFGVAKVLGVIESEERDREVIGSPHYIAPEQLRGSTEISARTDVWALGVVLYKALTDSFPFEGDSISELCKKIRDAVPYPIRDARPDCPLGLQDVVRRCLMKDPTARYADANELANALLPYVPDDGDEFTVLEESTRLMPAARGLQQASALESISRLRGAQPEMFMLTGPVPITPSSRPPLSSTSLRSLSTLSFAADSALRGPKGRMWWGAALLAAVLFAGSGIYLMVAAAEARRAAPSSVKVRVASDPAGAFFTLDYGVQMTAPREISLRRDDRTHVLMVWKDGFRPETRDVSATSDTNVEIKLAPIR